MAGGAPITPADLSVNDQVAVRQCSCTIRFVGPTRFADGTWIGVEFPTACGRNDGSVDGFRYFECPPQHGLFVRPDNVLVRKGFELAKLGLRIR